MSSSEEFVRGPFIEAGSEDHRRWQENVRLYSETLVELAYSVRMASICADTGSTLNREQAHKLIQEIVTKDDVLSHALSEMVDAVGDTR